MANKKPLVMYNGQIQNLKDSDNILDKESYSIASRANSIANEIITNDIIINPLRKWTEHLDDLNIDQIPEMYNNTIFNNSNVKYINNIFRIDKDITNLIFHLYYMPTTNDPGNISWIIKYMTISNYYNINLSINTLIKSEYIPNNSKYINQVTTFSLSNYDCQPSDFILINISRDLIENENTYSGDLVMIDCSLTSSLI